MAIVTAYYMHPLQRPSKQIIDTIEYNLEQLDDLSVDELEVLKETTDSLIEHIKKIKYPRQWKMKVVTGKEIREVGVTIDRNVP